MSTILVVDDSRIQLRLVQKICEEQCPGAKVLTFESGESCLAGLPKNTSDVVLAIIDQNMDGMSGTDLIALLTQRGVLAQRTILCTANGQETIATKARDLGVTFIKKPIESSALGTLFKNILQSGSK